MDKTRNSTFTTRKRLFAVLAAAILLFIVLFGRLGYIQLMQGASLQTKAAEQWYRDLPLSAPRGSILDINGEILADNKDIYTVYVRPKAVKDVNAVATALSENLSVDRGKLTEKIKAASVSEITVARQVDTQTGRRLIDLGLDGVYFTVDSKRNYPEGNFLSQVLGFTNIDNIGQNGIEGYYDTYLKGIDGFSYTETDIKGKELDNSVTSYVPPIAGSNVKLSVDAYIQAAAGEAVAAVQKEFGARAASMIVMDANTGGVLALAQTPSFDLNNIPRDDIENLNALSKNTMIVDVFEPGSTFKIFTTAAAIENSITSDKKSYYCPGYRIVDGQRIKCWRSIGHGSQNLSEGVKNSCNCVFMDLALTMGTDKLYDKLREFGFGEKTGIDFYGESRGILMNQKSVKNVDLARIGFGQAVAVTPLQLAAGVSAAINGGILYEPYFVDSVSTHDGNEYYKHEPTVVRRVISKSTSDQMRELLIGVVNEGSGKKAQVAGFSVGGKTGTAQKYKDGAIDQGKYISSFVGFASAGGREYVALMIVDEPQGYLYYGSLVAAPYVGQVFNKVFNYKGLKPTLPIDTQTVTMPELTGESLLTAVKAVNALGLKYEMIGEGGTILSTVPVATTVIPKGDVILLRTG